MCPRAFRGNWRQFLTSTSHAVLAVRARGRLAPPAPLLQTGCVARAVGEEASPSRSRCGSRLGYVGFWTTAETKEAPKSILFVKSPVFQQPAGHSFSLGSFCVPFSSSHFWIGCS